MCVHSNKLCSLHLTLFCHFHFVPQTPPQRLQQKHTYKQTYICTEKLTLTLSRLIVVDVVLLEGERGVSFCMTKQNPRQRNNLPKIVRRLKCRLQQLHTHIQKQKKHETTTTRIIELKGEDVERRRRGQRQ